MKSKFQLLTLALACFLTLSSASAFAKNDKPPKQSKGKKAEAPFDAGLSLVIAAGAAYSLKRARDSRKSKANTSA